MLCSNALSTCCCLRGGKEIAELHWAQVDLDYKPERGDYEGREALKINNLIDKTNNLGLNNSYARDDNVGFYIVKNPNDVLCMYALLERLRSLSQPGQKRVFCQMASKAKIQKKYCKQ